jgi:hypothetical protein
MSTVNTPDQIATARLMALKQAVRLEAVGMKHSSGKSLRKVAARELGLAVNASYDTVIGALAREIDRCLKAQRQEHEFPEGGIDSQPLKQLGDDE